MTTTEIDRSRLEAFMGQVVVHLAASYSALLVGLGARLGLYRAHTRTPSRSVDLETT